MGKKKTQHDFLKENVEYLRGTGELLGKILKIDQSPDELYGKGWWMITNILKSENGKAKVMGIVSDYKKVFEEYNNSLPDNSDDLKIIF